VLSVATLPKHLETDCQHVSVACPHAWCQVTNIPRSTLDHHLYQCQSYHVGELCASVRSLRSTLQQSNEQQEQAEEELAAVRAQLANAQAEAEDLEEELLNTQAGFRRFQTELARSREVIRLLQDENQELRAESLRYRANLNLSGEIAIPAVPSDLDADIDAPHASLVR
jgi:septal ring factor EnvC (AmiA/AmiB activator)